MIRTINKIGFLIGLLFFAAGVVQARQPNGNSFLVKQLYDQLHFEDAVKSGRELLRNERLYSRDALVLIHQYMAYSFFNLSERDSARAHFLTILSLKPETELDVVSTSPKIIAFFKQVRNEFEQLKSENKIIAVNHYVFVEDKRPGAAWRSALFPGWGQYYKNQSVKAYVVGSTFTGGIVFATITFLQEKRYKDLYLKETDTKKIPARYTTYNNYSKARRLISYATLAVWVVSFADALWTDYLHVSVKSSAPQTVSLAFQFNF